MRGGIRHAGLRALAIAPQASGRRKRSISEACRCIFAYLARRFGMMLLVVVLAVTINFVIPRLMPGDPVEQQLNQLAASGGGQIGDVQAIAASYRAKFGLDQPVLTAISELLGRPPDLRSWRLARPSSGDRCGDRS